MSFRKKSVVISQRDESDAAPATQPFPGIRPSPITGHPTTSTGTESLNQLLGLGAGLALGSSLLIEEEGTTEFSRSLLSCFAAEGVVQGHAVVVVGPEGSLVLPGLAEGKDTKGLHNTSVESEKMKIAWRYERLGNFEDRERGTQRQGLSSQEQELSKMPFCHTFDLTKRLAIPSSSHPPSYVIPGLTSDNDSSPFLPILARVRQQVAADPSTPIRLVIPSLLSPLIYSPQSSQPHHLLGFLQQLRSLLRNCVNLVIMMSWPLALYPPSNTLTHWVRILVDGVVTLRPFPHSFSVDALDIDTAGGGSAGKQRSEEKMQGLIKVIKLPVLSERSISVGAGEDMAFAVGRKRFLVRPFHLPPLEDEPEKETDSGSKYGESLNF